MVAFADGSVMTDSDNVKKLQLENALNEGKRALALNDYQSAADLLSTAAQLSVEVFGELEKGVFEPHFYYGKVLLELERVQKGNVITEAIGGEDDLNEDTDSDEDILEDEGTEPSVMEQNGDSITQVTRQTDQQVQNDIGQTESAEQVTVAVEKKEDDKYIEEVSGHTVSNGAAECSTTTEENNKTAVDLDEKKDNIEETAIGEPCSVNDGGDDEEDAGPLQLAWEVLEVARAVCDRNISEEDWKEKKVEVLLVLAQCSLEGENYAQAVEDLDACIVLAKSIFEPFDRRLAEANYQAGQACCLSGDFWSAADYFSKAKDILVAKRSDLEKKLKSLEDNDKDGAVKELEELKALIPEIQLKIEDSKGSGEAEKLKKVAMEKLAQALAGQKPPPSENVSTDKAVDDISVLVRKKGQKRNVGIEDSDAAKRSKTVESGQN